MFQSIAMTHRHASPHPFFLATTSAVALMISALPGWAADPCAGLAEHEIHLTANEFEGVMAPGVGLRLQAEPDGGYTFQTTVKFKNEPVDKVVGTCRGIEVRFTRERPGEFTQNYVGEIGKNRRLQGTFSQNGVGTYSWSGSLKAGKGIE